MLNALDCELFGSSLVVYDIEQVVHGGFLLSFMNQLKEEVFLHDVAVHKDVLCLLAADVRFDSEDGLFIVKLKCFCVQICDVSIAYLMIKESDVCAGSDMLVKKSSIILSEYHVRRNDYYIVSFYALDNALIEEEGSDICVVDLIYFFLIREEQGNFAALAVDTVMTACANMLCK